MVCTSRVEEHAQEEVLVAQGWHELCETSIANQALRVREYIVTCFRLLPRATYKHPCSFGVSPALPVDRLSCMVTCVAPNA